MKAGVNVALVGILAGGGGASEWLVEAVAVCPDVRRSSPAASSRTASRHQPPAGPRMPTRDRFAARGL